MQGGQICIVDLGYPGLTGQHCSVRSLEIGVRGLRSVLEKPIKHFWVVGSNICYVHPYLGKWSQLTHIFQMGWNHQLDLIYPPWNWQWVYTWKWMVGIRSFPLGWLLGRCELLVSGRVIVFVFWFDFSDMERYGLLTTRYEIDVFIWEMIIPISVVLEYSTLRTFIAQNGESLLTNRMRWDTDLCW